MNTPYSDQRPGTGDGRFQSQAFPEGFDASSGAQTDASVGSLLKELAHEVPALLRNEVALARSEMREQAAEAGKSVGAMATGGAVATAGLVVLLMAVVYALSEVMQPWLAALIVGGIALLVGYSMVSAGRKKLKEGSLRPERTMESLRRDKNAVRGGIQ